MAAPLSTPKLRLSGTILAVDDDEVYRKQLQGILDRHNIPCIMQESATHALRFLQNQPWNWRPALVITDIVMDGMGGYQLIRRIQELYPTSDIPVLVVSKLSGGIDVGEAEVAGAAAYITKPATEDKIISALEKLTKKERRGMLIYSAEFNGKPSRKY